MKTVIADTETNGMLDAVTKLHCVQIGDEDGDDAVLYGDSPLCDEPLENGYRRLQAADRIVGHNFIGYDWFIGEKFFPKVMRFEQVADTLILARMAFITERNHSLAAWGMRIGNLKDDYKGDYQTFDEEFAKYSRQDIVVGRALWKKVKHALEWGEGRTYEIEAKAAYCTSLQEQYGFLFDVKGAELLHADLAQELGELKAKLKDIFPAFNREEVFIPKRDNSKLGYKKDVPFIKKWESEFNPRSRQQIAEALRRDGWVPMDFTQSGQAEVSEATLTTVNHPGAKSLIAYLKTSKTMGAIVGDGKKSKGYLQLIKPDGRIHGRVNTLGAVTWRMAHSNPNTANVSKDPRVRSLYIASPGRVLCGCDGREIQARFLAHYLHPYDDGAYSDKLLRGDKALGTDGHTLNLKALQPYGLVSRDGAKTALYARIFGCRAPRMWATVNEDRVKHDLAPFPENKIRSVGQGAINALGQSMPGLDDLISDVQHAGKTNGKLRGIGGAWVPVSAPHSALVSLLQHGEAVAMKMALGIFEFEHMQPRGYVHGRDYGYCSNVHDEVQFETLPELAQEFADLFSECIAEAGRRLGTRCPLAGEAKLGANWQETH